VSNISIDQLGDAISAQLNTFEKNVRDGVKKAVDETMDEMVRETRSTAQVRTGRYKRKISATVGENTLMKYSKVWHVKNPDYRLAHLLDKGHTLRNGRRYEGNQHVANAEHRAVENFQRKLEEVIRDAGSEN
jgi:hypothetical protein